MDDDAIAAYLRSLGEALRRAGRPTQPLVDEAAAHLSEDAARIAAADGCGDAEAARRAVARFGGVDDVLRSVRTNTPLFAARLARVATIGVAAAITWEVIDGVVGGDFWPLSHEDLWFLFVAEIAAVGIYLWRALDGRRVPGWLGPALAANGALALALVVVQTLSHGLIPHLWNVGPSRAVADLWAPLWPAMALQAVGGLRALSVSRRGSTSAS